MRVSVLKAAIAAALFSFAVSSSPARATAQAGATIDQQILGTLFERGLLSNEFTPDIVRIAAQYVRRTPFAGRVRINRPPVEGALNIYVFWSKDRFPRDTFVRNSCTAFPLSSTIICDHDFLDSMPSSFPFLLEGQQEIPAPALMYWALGHEIGHVVMKHRTAGFAGTAADVSAAPQSADSAKTVLAEESEADIFAMTGLPVATPEEWIYFGGPFVDAWYWELSKRGLGGTSPNQLTEVSIRLTAASHPPLIKRLYGLIETIRRTFTNFPFDNRFARTLNFRIENAPPGEYAAPFYDGTYVRSETSDEERTRELLDLATADMLAPETASASALRTYMCGGSVGTSRVWTLQQNIVCRTAPSESVAALLEACPTSKEEAARCQSLIPLLELACARTGVAEAFRPACRDVPMLRAVDDRYRRTAVEAPDDLISLRPWVLTARYRHMRDVAKEDPDAIESWLQQMGQNELLGADTSLILSLLVEHGDYLAGQGKASWERVADFNALASRYSRHVENDRLALDYQRRVVTALKANKVPSAMLGFHLLRLAALMRDFQMPHVGKSEAVGAGLEIDSLRAAAEEGSGLRAEAAAVSEEAAEAYRLAVEEARSGGDTRAVTLFQPSYITALSDIVYSYNAAMETEKALAAAERLTEELAARADLRKQEKFDIDVLVPAYENASQPHITSARGSANKAIAMAREAADIRKAHKRERSLALRTLAYALYKAGKFREARETADVMVREFEAETSRKYPVEGGYLISGEFVTLAQILSGKGE